MIEGSTGGWQVPEVPSASSERHHRFMEGLSAMSEKEFADWLRSVPREKSPQAAQAAEEKRDRERGPYVPHHHHAYREEARH